VVQRSNITIDGNGLALEGIGTVDSKGIYISDVSSITVKNTYIKGFYSGIYLNSTSNNSISQNTIAGNAYGVELCNITQSGYELQFNHGSSNNTISGNSITNSSGHGIVLLYSSNNSIYGNDITNSSGNGIELDSSSYNNIHGNIVTGNGLYGIWFVLSYNNTVSRNNVTANQDGVWLYGSSNNTVSGNNIENNANGIGIERYDEGYIPAENNMIFHNNFINNTYQVYVSGEPSNAWDDGYPSGGNYWSDYNGTDANHDGIGDTAYIIDSNNIDHHPLMVPYVIPEFPSFLILPLFFTTTLLAITGKDEQRQPEHSAKYFSNCL
jgi:parallel beta-helix repeat protein